MPWRPAHSATASGSRVMIAEQKLRWLPCTSIWLASGHSALNVPSMCDGATYLPPEVLNRSFLRSVIRTKPSGSISPMSPVCSQPSPSSASAVVSAISW